MTIRSYSVQQMASLLYHPQLTRLEFSLKIQAFRTLS